MNSIACEINQIVFPQNYSNVFAAVAKNQIRIFNTNTLAELLCIKLESEV